MTVRAAALHRADRLQISDRIFGNAIGLIALIQGTFPETSAVGRLFSSPVHLASKMKFNTSCRQVQAASDGALLFISFNDQPDAAALPYVAVRRTSWHRLFPAKETGFIFSLSLFFAMNAEPDKQAQESVTGCYIMCNAAEPHD